MTTSDRKIECRYFDGHSSMPHAAELRVEAGHAVVEGPGVARREPLSRVGVSERMGDAPRLVSFTDGAFCEVRDHAGLDGLLGDTGFREPLVARLQSRWSMAIAAVVLCLAAGAWAYLEFLPWAAERAAAHLPANVLDGVSEQTLAALDQHFMAPSALPEARRQTLSHAFERMTPPDGERVRHRLLFRHSDRLGPNAFALPSGTIVVTDELVALAGSDDEVLAVLCHELGHVQGRHGLRQVLQSSVVGLVVTWYLGDVSTLLTAVPAALLEARYSRDHEREADDYAVRMLKFNAMPPALLANMLERLEAARQGPRDRDDKASSDASDYLASHPATSERLRNIRGH